MQLPDVVKNANHASLRAMSREELDALCAEIRTLLIDVVSTTGGHLASNLGVVELTVALHRVFSSPRDKFIWDVGHQCYVHKILTGRGGALDTLRQFGGLSGFPKRCESIHDIFETGHSATSLSAAIGLACAQQHSGEEGKVVAIIGDGALTGGMAYEAMNQIGSAKLPLIMVLNDNEMSISPNVGALHFHLTKFRVSKPYVSFKRNVAQRFPRMKRVLERVKNSFKYMFYSSAFFEEMGIKYIGPVDGHNVVALEKIFERVSHLTAPVVVHVLTTKGKGYEPAEMQPERFHGISGGAKAEEDVVCDGKPRTLVNSEKKVELLSTLSNSLAFGDELCLLAEKNPRIVAITAAMADGTGLRRFAEKYPGRFYDVGIAEQHAVTFAAGLATGGMRPVVALYSTFLQRAYDQLLHDVCLQNLPVVICVDRCGPVGQDGPTHHGVYDIPYLTQMPNLTVFSPSSQRELRRMLELAVTMDGPVAIRYPRGSLLPEEIGSGPEDLRNWTRWGEWQQTTIVATGQMVEVAKETALLLQSNGYPATVVNARCLLPMDDTMLKEIGKRTRCLVVLEDGVAAGGLGEHIAGAMAATGQLPEKYMAFAIPREPLPQGDLPSLFTLAGLTPKQLQIKIIRGIEEFDGQKEQAGR